MATHYKYFKYSFEEAVSETDQTLYAAVKAGDGTVGYVPVKIPKGSCPAIVIEELQRDLLKNGFEILYFSEIRDILKVEGK